jgi:RNA-directed DNA polymerase
MYDALCSWQNILIAYSHAARGKRGQPNVAGFEHRLEENLTTLREELVSKSYRPGSYDSFYIHEPKRRLISAAPFRDRVVHHALCNVIEPIFERTFVFDSYANRLGKGTHRALDRCQQFARQYRFVLQCDVEQFFPAIDHAVLRDILFPRIKDESVRRLAERILRSGEGILRDTYRMSYFTGDDLLSILRPRGLPIGNLTSQFWANCYLNPFDHFVKRELRCKAYLRYVDDFLLFADDKETLWQWKQAIVERLEQLRLKIHQGAHPRPVTEGIPFLGFVVYPDKRRLKRRKGVHFQRKLRNMAMDYGLEKVNLNEISSSIRSWINHVRYANTVGLRKSILRKTLFRSPCKPTE